MNFQKEIKQLLIPLLKGSPVIIGLMVLAFLLTRRAISYMNPKYQSNAMIRINGSDNQMTTFDAFSKDGGGAKGSGNFLTEVEVLKSKQMAEQTLQNLDFELTLYRKGEIRMTELYKESPFTLSYKLINAMSYDKLYELEYMGEDQFRYLLADGQAGEMFGFDSPVLLDGMEFQLSKNIGFIKHKPQSLQLGDRFAFKINSMDALVKQYSGADLFIKPVDKEVSIIKVYFNHEVPAKAKLYVNSLLNTYIHQGQGGKRDQVDQTLDYLDEQLTSVTDKLRTAEADLAYYRAANGMLNQTLETDNTLRELSQLDMSKVDLQIKKVELERLYAYLESGNSLNDFSPNFEALQDPIFRDTYLKIKNYELQRKDMSMKYTATSEEIRGIDDKVRSLRTFINASVVSTLENLRLRNREISGAIAELKDDIKKYPHKERKLVTLEREVQLQEQMYNYLMQKRTELEIMKTSNLFPHEVIDPARLPDRAVTPNKPLLYGVSVLLAMLAGMAISYVYSFFTAKVRSRLDVQERMGMPILATIPQRSKKARLDGFSLSANLMAALERLLEKDKTATTQRGHCLVISSMDKNEGKTFTTVQLGKALSASGKKVLLIDMDLNKPEVHEAFGLPNVGGISAVLQRSLHPLKSIMQSGVKDLDIIPAGDLSTIDHAMVFSETLSAVVHDLRWHYDYILVDTSNLNQSIDALPMMYQSSINLILVRAGHTQLRKLNKVSRKIEEYAIPELHLVLNSVKGGNFHPRKVQSSSIIKPLKSASA